jgi:predicted small metal-binding protein
LPDIFAILGQSNSAIDGFIEPFHHPTKEVFDHGPVAISADSREELLEAAVQHATSVHEHVDTPELREELLKGIKEGAPGV